MDVLGLQVSPLEEWPCGCARRPILVAGPCSAESESQVLATARALTAIGGISLFRAGVWKPRSRPGSFQGAGRPALAWLVDARRETGLPVCVEVANTHHVEACLGAGVDALWVGARTTVNPFYMQEIAESLRGVGVPVMVKNPVNPELGLWVGALERLNKVGVTRILAIHRGFSSFAPSEYRNEPFWEIPIELKRRAPSLPILCDPSHIAGDASLVARIAQKAIEMDMEGLMIEVHVRPKDALSDAGQQLDPAQFDALLSSLVLRRSASDDAEFNRRLAVLRGVIDQLDRRLLETLAERMRVVEEIGQWKREKEVTVFQLERWAEICQTRRSKGHSLGLDQALVKELFELIHKHGIRRQIP